MAYSTGTSSNYGSMFAFPSGTTLYAVQVVGFPEISQGERNTTNHGSSGYENRLPNGLTAVGDFTLKMISTPTAILTLKTDLTAGTVRSGHLKNPVYQYTFDCWIKSIKEEDADAASPDSVMATIVVTPVGSFGMANS